MRRGVTLAVAVDLNGGTVSYYGRCGAARNWTRYAQRNAEAVQVRGR